LPSIALFLYRVPAYQKIFVLVVHSPLLKPQIDDLVVFTHLLFYS